MTLEEMRRVYEAATAGEWTHASGYVRCGNFFLADVTLVTDAEAMVMAHNKFAKLLAVAEAAKAYLNAMGPVGESKAHLAMMVALAALGES